MIGHRVVLRPRSLLESGDLAFGFVRRHWRTYLRLLPWVVVPALAGWLCDRLVGLGAYGGWLVTLIAAGIGTGVFVRLCGELMLKDDIDLRALQREFRGSLMGWIGTNVFTALVLFASILFAYPWLAFVPEGVLLERSTSTEAMKRSVVLIKATPGRSTGFFVSSVVFALFTTFGLEAVVTSVLGLFGFPPNPNASLAGYLGFALALPYLTTWRFLLYIDCRTRREGWDLQVQFAALVNGAAGAPTPDAKREVA